MKNLNSFKLMIMILLVSSMGLVNGYTFSRSEEWCTRKNGLVQGWTKLAIFSFVGKKIC